MAVLAVFVCALIFSGASLWTIQSLRPDPTPLIEIVTGFGQRPRGVSLTDSLPHSPSGFERARQQLIRLVWRDPSKRMSMDLAICGTSMEDHLVARLAGSLAVLALSIPANLVLGLMGVPLNPMFAALMTMSGVALAALLPGLRLERRANQRRLGFRHALSGYLDLVTILMAGGAGLLGALGEAAESGDGWVFAAIRDSLRRAQLAGVAGWEGLRELGDRMGISELEDLANTVDLAGEHGARVVEALASQGDSLRQQLRFEIESEAERASERLLVPAALLLLPLLLFFVPALMSMFGQGAVLAPTSSQVVISP